jgi:hypothetical protein
MKNILPTTFAALMTAGVAFALPAPVTSPSATSSGTAMPTTPTTGGAIDQRGTFDTYKTYPPMDDSRMTGSSTSFDNSLGVRTQQQTLTPPAIDTNLHGAPATNENTKTTP